MEKGSGSGSNKSAWVIIGIIAALLLGCLLGSCAGGAVGYALANRRAIRTDQRSVTVVPQGPSYKEPNRETDFVEVLRVVKGSPAEEAGIAAGDLILALNGNWLGPDASLAYLLRQQQPGDLVILTVARGGKQFDVPVTLGANPAIKQQAWLGIYY